MEKISEYFRGRKRKASPQSEREDGRPEKRRMKGDGGDIPNVGLLQDETNGPILKDQTIVQEVNKGSDDQPPKPERQKPISQDKKRKRREDGEHDEPTTEEKRSSKRDRVTTEVTGDSRQLRRPVKIKRQESRPIRRGAVRVRKASHRNSTAPSKGKEKPRQKLIGERYGAETPEKNWRESGEGPSGKASPTVSQSRGEPIGEPDLTKTK